jgi:eukaryotic-like serine/threonine-protein kinase
MDRGCDLSNHTSVRWRTLEGYNLDNVAIASMNCPTCNEKLISADSVCKRCGTRVDTPSPTMTIRQIPDRTVTVPLGCPEPAESQFEEGSIIGNRYKVLSRIGEGGMGTVYKVLDVTLDKIVALKTIHPDMAHNARALEMFKKELILARQVTHKNVCRLFDLGQDNDVCFLTMEFLEGKTLRSLIRADGKPAPKQAAEIMLQVAMGLEAAHESGIVHRDLKPDNLMIQEDGRLAVMDFGIARPLEEVGTGFAGTPAYASPEQLLRQPQDQRSDVYSFGLIFYEVLYGKSPFPKPKTLAEARQHAVMTPPPLVERDSGIPKELSDIVARCLAINPQERFASARELVLAIEAWLHPKPFYAKTSFTWLLASGVVILSISSVLWTNRPPPPAPPPVSMLIADFENKTQDRVFDGAFEPALQVALEGASFITAYDRGQAKRLIAQLRPGQPVLDAEGARLVAAREGIAAVVKGSIEPQGSRYRIAVRVMNPADGKDLAPEQRETVAREKVLGAAGRLAAPVRRALGDKTAAGEQIAAAETFTAASLEAANRYSAAQELQSAGRRDEAEQAYLDAIRLDPNMGRAYSGLAVLNRNRGRISEALKNFDLALSHINRMSEREKLRTRGGYYVTSNNPGKAVEEFTALVQKFPADTGGYSNLALALLGMRQTTRALSESLRAVEIYPKDLKNRNNYALYAMYAGDYETTRREAAAVLKENPAFEKAYIAIALSALAQERPQDAEEAYQRLGAVSARGSSMAAAGLADLAAYQGRLDDATNILQRAITADEAAKRTEEAAHKYAALARAYAKLGRKQEAQKAAQLAALGTVDLGTLMEAALAHIDSGAPTKAAAIAAKFREKVGAENQVAAMLIDGYGQLSRSPVEAINTFQKAQKTLDTWLGHFFLGRASLLAKDRVQAQAEFELCLKRAGEATAVFLDEAPTARLLPPVWYHLAQATEGMSEATASQSYQRFLALQAARSQDPLAAAARLKLGK